MAWPCSESQNNIMHTISNIWQVSINFLPLHENEFKAVRERIRDKSIFCTTANLNLSSFPMLVFLFFSSNANALLQYTLASWLCSLAIYIFIQYHFAICEFWSIPDLSMNICSYNLASPRTPRYGFAKRFLSDFTLKYLEYLETLIKGL